MKISENGKNLIKKYEGCRLTAYYCPSGILTIGWGHTGDVKEGQTITQSEADRLFDLDIQKYEVAHKYGNFNQNQFDALTSFAYNCGVGALQEVCSYGDIPSQMALYVNGSNGPLEGLKRRRKEEIELYNTPVTSEASCITYKETGVATVLPSVLNVRSEPDTSKDNVVVQYYKGETINYQEVYICNGYVWIKYKSWQGFDRYVASRKIDNSEIYLKCT